MPTQRNTTKPRRKTTPSNARSPEHAKEPRAEWNPDGSGARAKRRSASDTDPGNLTSLPHDLRSRIDRAIVERPSGLKSVRKIYDHFVLKDHGITYKSFSAYVRREGWRSRLAATGQVVEAMFGASDRDEADRLCNSAYLSLMSTVVRTLQEDKEQFPTAELARLSKIITEQRAVGVKERDVELKTAKQAGSAAGNDKAKPLTTGLPDNFDEIVRRIYGVEIKGD
ncbi:MAG: DUF3486 family protein [Planctomycetes bacterium]|nr:DUF3486 family protein [Planctomycetota bacterium]